MDDLLKEAIADAKAVRETALENAKIALEEAFTPRLQSMLAKKIQSEIDVDEQDDEFEDEDEEEAPEDEAPEEFEEDDEDPSDEFSDEEPEDDMGDEEEDDGMEAEGYDESDIIEINGVKYAPVVSEEEDEEAEEEDEEDEMEKSDDLDLEAVLRELEEDEEVDESKDEEVDESKEEEVDESKEEEVDESKEEEVDESKEEEVDESKEEIDEEEDIDLEEVIAALSEEENEEEAVNEVAKLQSELDEHRNVVKYLRTKLNEVNLLNAKLLFTNKLFRSYGLSNDQKMKVVETFDRAHNLREVKLVYSTLAESFGSKPKTEIKESKGSASKAVASTKSEKQEVIAEGHEMRDRFKKLAGIL
jgi:hypothetical protein